MSRALKPGQIRPSKPPPPLAFRFEIDGAARGSARNLCVRSDARRYIPASLRTGWAFTVILNDGGPKMASANADAANDEPSKSQYALKFTPAEWRQVLEDPC